MRNRRQTIPGRGGAPREGSASRETVHRLRDVFPADVASAPRGANDIGRAGQTGHFSS